MDTIASPTRTELSEPANPRRFSEPRRAGPERFRARESRIQDSWTAAPERRLLQWLAARMPAPLGPDHLTVLGLLSQVGAGACYALAARNRYALLGVIAFLVLNWLGDSLDGTLARVRRCQRPRYGFYVDHVVDAFGTFFLLGGLAVSGYMSERVAVGLLIVYFMLSIEVYLAT